MSKGPIFQSFKINQVEEKPKESKVLNVDFSALLNPEQKMDVPPQQPSSDAVSSHSQSSHNRDSYHTHHHSSSSNEYVYGINDKHNDNWIRRGLIVKILNKKLGDGS